VDGRGTVIVLPNEDEVLEAIAVGVPAGIFAVRGFPEIPVKITPLFWGVK